MIISYLLLLLAACFLSAGLGRDINTGEAPWQVSLQLNGTHHCSGAIYSWNIIITAAFCFYQKMGPYFVRAINPYEILIVAGTPYKTAREEICAVMAMKHHENYKIGPTISQYDIGILKLWWPFRLRGMIKAIPLHKGNIPSGAGVLSTGWGPIAVVSPITDFVFPEKLQGTYVVIGDPAMCKKYLPWMSTDIICGGVSGYPGCWGDPGGSLVYNKQLVGIVSGGNIHCAGPVFYTSVQHYLSWLIQETESI